MVALVVVLAAAMPGSAATSTSVVGANVVSATTLTVTGCLPNVLNKTDLGTLAVSTTARSTVDCSVGFGSSNDTAALRLGQTDSTGDALVRAEFGPQNSTTGNHLKGAALVDGNTAWFAGYGGRIIKTTDAGTTWVQQVSGTGNRLYDIDAASATTAWAVGETGTVVATTDGATWSTQTSGVATDLNGLTSASTTRAWTVGANGVIRTTADGGATPWTAQASTVATDLQGIDAASANVLWAVGNSGVVLKTIDGGTTWALQYTASEWVLDVHAISEQVAWATGRDGLVLRTVNGGTTWTPVTAPTIENLSDIAALNASVAWVVGDLGSIYVTYDAGATWRNLSRPTAISFDSVAAISGRAWVGGQSGELYVSPLEPVPDYVDGVTDWNQGAAAFGVCISTVTNASTTWDDEAGCRARSERSGGGERRRAPQLGVPSRRGAAGWAVRGCGGVRGGRARPIGTARYHAGR